MRAALDACRQHLLSLQRADGHWCGDLEGGSILESEYFLTLYFLERQVTPRMLKAAARLRASELREGGWPLYPGGPAEVSSSVKAYFVLKLAGDDPAAAHMRAARETILQSGGIDACNSFTKIYLAIFGQVPWSQCPVIPPEIALLPRGARFSLYRMSSWTRSIVVPLAIIRSSEPHCPVPPAAELAELRAGDESARRAQSAAETSSYAALFVGLDRLLGALGRLRLTPLRRALERCEQWILERLEDSDGLGAIFPPIINTLIALRCLGYPLEHPVLRAQRAELERLTVEREDGLIVQPCHSPVWDTALAVHTLAACGLGAGHPALLAGVRWLLAHEVRRVADVREPEQLPLGGWYFQYANAFNPDTDDTSQVLLALARVRFPDAAEETQRQAAMMRGITWQLAMQSRDGGWGAFDRDCDDEILTHVPFADHNAMLDPSCEDITGRTLEVLCALGRRDTPAVQRAIAFLDARQRPDGTWYGRWGCNYLYGTFLALRGLAAAGIDLRAPRWLRVRDWLLERQNDDGGWGELPASYDDPELAGRGPSTAAQTAWGLLSLGALGELDSPHTRRAVDYLLLTQHGNGAWRDAFWTGTGFPRVFYLNYHLYSVYFPLWALSEVERAQAPHRKARRPAPARALPASGRRTRCTGGIDLRLLFH